MIYLDKFEEIYSSMIAGSVPSADGSLASVLLIVQDILGTSAIHIFWAYSEADRRVYYFAAPSAVLHSTEKMTLPLAAAIPVHRAHRGDGVYILTQGPSSAAAVFAEGDLRFYFNSTEAVEEAIRETGLPVFDVGSIEGEPFESLRGKYRRVGETLSRRVLSIYGMLALSCAVVYLGLSAAIGYFERSHVEEKDLRSRSIEKLANSISFASPLHERLARLQAVAAVVVRSGGWIESYEFEGGQESFNLMMPEWVTPDHYAQLGGGVSADIQSDGMVAVVKAKAVTGGAGQKAGKPGNAATSPVESQPPANGASQSTGTPHAMGGPAPAGAPARAPAGTPPGAPDAANVPRQAPFGSPESRPPSSSTPQNPSS